MKNCSLSCLKQAFHLKQATSTVSWLLQWIRSSSVGGMAVAPRAVLWDVREPMTFSWWQIPFCLQVLQRGGSSCSWNPASSVGVRGGWLNSSVVFQRFGALSALLTYICSPYGRCLQELSRTSLRRSIKPGSLSGLTPKEFFWTVHNFWGFINIRAF